MSKLIHIYQGNGKGKTTAAAGLCARALGADWRVGWAAFLKDGRSSELCTLSAIDGFSLFACQENVPFTFCMTEEQRHNTAHFYKTLLREIERQAASFDLVVFDEVLDAVQTGLITEDALLQLIDCIGDTTELVLTGRCASPALCDRADYITTMTADKHPYDSGVSARRGIEY